MIIRQDTDPKKDRVGPELTAGHPLHAKTDLQLFDPILAVPAALSVPLKNLLGSPLPVRGDHLVPHGAYACARR
jgi:hypothetical protein